MMSDAFKERPEKAVWVGGFCGGDVFLVEDVVE
jgi:hypothetical protein